MNGPSPVARASLALGAIVTIGLYVWAFDGRVRNVGWDAAASVVQVRAASAGILDLPATRPGTAAVGAFVAGVGVAPDGATPIVVSIAAAASLGLAAAAALRGSLDLPSWGIGIAVLMVGTWGGTLRLAAGYLANLVSLGTFVLAVGIAVSATPRWWLVGVAFAGALLAHPGLAPAYGAILIAWVLVELIRDREERRALLAFAAFAVASLAMVLLVGGAIGVDVGDLQDLSLVRERFDERAAELLAWISPPLSLAMVAAGIVVGLTGPQRIRSRPAARLAIVWIAVCAAGLLVLVVAPAVPGHRMVPLAVPVPILGAVAIVAAASTLARRRTAVRPELAPIAALAAAIVLSLVMVRPFVARANRASDGLGPMPASVAGYLRDTRPSVPVIVVMDPSSRLELLAWKARLNAIRALGPAADPGEVVVYVGDVGELAAGRPTHRADDALFDEVADRTWPDARDARSRGAVIVVPRPWVPPEEWRDAAARAAVVGDLAIVGGPAPAAIRPATAPTLSRAGAAGRIAALLIVLAAIGGGWAAVAAPEGPTAAGFAPALGLVVVTLAGTAVALAGGGPGGPAGWAAVSIVGATGWILAWRSRVVPRSRIR